MVPVMEAAVMEAAVMAATLTMEGAVLMMVPVMEATVLMRGQRRRCHLHPPCTPPLE